MGLSVTNHVLCVLFITDHTHRRMRMYTHTLKRTYTHTCTRTHMHTLALSLSLSLSFSLSLLPSLSLHPSLSLPPSLSLSQLQEPFLSAIYIIYLTLTAASIFSVCKFNLTHQSISSMGPLVSPYSNFNVVISLSPNYFITLYLLPASYKNINLPPLIGSLWIPIVDSGMIAISHPFLVLGTCRLVQYRLIACS